MFTGMVLGLAALLAGQSSSRVAEEIVGTPAVGTVPVPRRSAGPFGASSADLRYDNAGTTGLSPLTRPIRTPDALSSAALGLSDDTTTAGKKPARNR